MSRKKIVVIFYTLISLVLISCTSKTDEDSGFKPTGSPADREALLVNVADNIIIPSYAKADVKIDSLVSKSKAFTDAPTQTTLDDLRTAWREAYIEWQKVELFDVGPANTYTLRFYTNTYPTAVAKINDNIASGTADMHEAFSYDAQGFPAFDFMINSGASDQVILDRYTIATDALKRVNYLKLLTSELNTKFDQVYNLWTSSYRAEFVSRTGTDASSSLSLLVNAYTLNYERYVRSGKIGIPSGALVNDIPSLQTIEALYKKDLSLTLVKTAQQASFDFFNGKSVIDGTEGPSFKTYLVQLGANDSQTGTALATVLGNQFQITNDKLNLLGPILYDDITNELPKVKEVYTSMQATVRLIKVDMSSAMSITISYVDADGD